VGWERVKDYSLRVNGVGARLRNRRPGGVGEKERGPHPERPSEEEGNFPVQKAKTEHKFESPKKAVWPPQGTKKPTFDR